MAPHAAVILGIVWVLAVCALPASSVDIISDGCALHDVQPVVAGYDVVNYFDIPSYDDGGVAEQGSREYAVNFRGYQFWFKNQANQHRFVIDPWAYAPRWGGFCSWGVARELPSDGWPWSKDHLGPPAGPWNGWAIVDGHLIFNIWASYTDRFLRDKDDGMTYARKRWVGWFGNLRAGPFNTHCIGEGPSKNWCLARQPNPWASRPCPRNAPFVGIKVYQNAVLLADETASGSEIPFDNRTRALAANGNPTNGPIEPDEPLVPFGHEEEPPAPSLAPWVWVLIAVVGSVIVVVTVWVVVQNVLEGRRRDEEAALRASRRSQAAGAGRTLRSVHSLTSTSSDRHLTTADANASAAAAGTVEFHKQDAAAIA